MAKGLFQLSSSRIKVFATRGDDPRVRNIGCTVPSQLTTTEIISSRQESTRWKCCFTQKTDCLRTISNSWAYKSTANYQIKSLNPSSSWIYSVFMPHIDSIVFHISLQYETRDIAHKTSASGFSALFIIYLMVTATSMASVHLYKLSTSHTKLLYTPSGGIYLVSALNIDSIVLHILLQ